MEDAPEKENHLGEVWENLRLELPLNRTNSWRHRSPTRRHSNRARMSVEELSEMHCQCFNTPSKIFWRSNSSSSSGLARHEEAGGLVEEEQQVEVFVLVLVVVVFFLLPIDSDSSCSSLNSSTAVVVFVVAHDVEA